MSTPAERAFIQHLVLPDSLAEIVHLDMPIEIIASEALRPIFEFATAYWHAESRSGVAPSPEMMRHHFHNTLSEHEIDLDIEPQDVLAVALATLRGAYVDAKWQKWTRDFSGYMASTGELGKANMLNQGIAELMAIQRAVGSKNEHIEIGAGVDRALEAFFHRRELRLSGEVNGAIFGLPLLDQHLGGIRDGELVIVGGPPKFGKSYMMIFAALANYMIGKTPVVFTLELPVETMIDRAACLAAGVDAGRWDRGECTDEEVERVRAWRAQLTSREHTLHVIQPDPGRRTAQHMTRRAKTLGDVMFVDQLTFVEPEPEVDREPRWRQVGVSLHTFKALLSSGSRISGFLAHQIKREGIAKARKVGYLEMDDFAEASEVERTADLAFAFWASTTQRLQGMCYFQMLAARRVEALDWGMGWKPWEPMPRPDGSLVPHVFIDSRGPINIRGDQ